MQEESNCIDYEKRLLVISPWGLGGGYSGPVVLMNRLFSALARRHRVEIDVLYRDRGNEIIPEWAAHAYPICAGNRGRFGRGDQIKWAVFASRFVSRNASKYQCVHLQGAYWSTLFPALFNKKKNISILPVLEAGDLSKSERPMQRRTQNFLRRQISKKTKSVFCLSKGIAAEAITAGWRSQGLVPIGNPVNTRHFYPVARPCPTARNVRLGFVGKLGPTKQPDLILSTIEKLATTGVIASATFVGPYATSEYQRHFTKKIDDLKLHDKVIVTGYTDDVGSLIRNHMDIFILPSKAEGMPGALAEAMSCGVPAIVTDVGEMGNVIDQSGGGIIVDGDSDSIALAVSNLLRDSGVYDQMSNNAASYASKKYSSEAAADIFFRSNFPEVEAIYHENTSVELGND